LLIELIVHSLQEEFLDDRLGDDLVGSSSNAHLFGEVAAIFYQRDQRSIGSKPEPAKKVKGLHHITHKVKKDELEVIE
jgi:hypothetical protein